MITQQDIDRLLAGRKLIDSIKRPDGDVLNALHADARASAEITIARALQNEVAELIEIEKQSILAVTEALIVLGFKGIGDLLERDKKLCFEEYCEIIQIDGECSKEKCPNKRCVMLFQSAACFYQTSVQADVNLKKLFFRLASKSTTADFADVKICPEGFGYSAFRRIREPRFDLYWRNHG